MVYPQENSFLSNRVSLVWGQDPDKHTYECTCKWCGRFLIPCRHVLAVAKGVCVSILLVCAQSNEHGRENLSGSGKGHDRGHSELW